MYKNYKEYIENVINRGLLCEEYKQKVSNAHSKHDLFLILSDANGVTFLPEMNQRGISTPYEYFVEFFSNFVNGKFVSHFNDDAFTSSIYCSYSKTIDVNTTLLLCLDCHCNIHVPSTEFVRIVVDTNSDVVVDMEDESMAIIEVYGNGKVDVKKEGKYIKIKNIR